MASGKQSGVVVVESGGWLHAARAGGPRMKTAPAAPRGAGGGDDERRRSAPPLPGRVGRCAHCPAARKRTDGSGAPRSV